MRGEPPGKTSGGLEVKPPTRRKPCGGEKMNLVEIDLSNLSDLEPNVPACVILRELEDIYEKVFRMTRGTMAIVELAPDLEPRIYFKPPTMDDEVVKTAAIIASYCGDECDADELKEIALVNAPVNEKYVDQAIEFLSKHIRTIITLDSGYETCVCLSDYEPRHEETWR